ncbi:hypothetical protein YC2023_060503 [Brassica napus]
MFGFIVGYRIGDVQGCQCRGLGKLKISLIIIVDGVLLATNQIPKPSVKHVKRLENLNK